MRATPRRGPMPTGRFRQQHHDDDDGLDHVHRHRRHAGLALHRARARLERAEEQAATTTPNGCSRPSSATAMAVKPYPGERFWNSA